MKPHTLNSILAVFIFVLFLFSAAVPVLAGGGGDGDGDGDGDGFICNPGEKQYQSCGNCGSQYKTCVNGYYWTGWSTCSGQGSCSPGQFQDQACGNCGKQTRQCQSNCQWGSWSVCYAQGSCSPGSRQSQSCGLGGTQTRTCTSSCNWGSWSSCYGEGECKPGDRQSKSCGNCGKTTRTCQSNYRWGSWGSCTGQGSCSPGATQQQGCGNCGTQARTCTSSCSWGSWGSCTGQGSCSPGATQQQGCGNGGTQTRTCTSSCSWGSWGNCEGEIQCNPGDTESKACGNCGTSARTCQSNGYWSSWSACSGEGSCSPGSTQQQACGYGGTQTRTCTSSCSWGSWSSCKGSGECNPGDTESKACGNCGTSARTCQSNYHWSSWSACSGEGECSSGATESKACGNCGTSARTCSSSCSWGSWSSCTGEGVCSPGETQSQQCGSRNGIQTRSCTSSCSWGSWGSCIECFSDADCHDGIGCTTDECISNTCYNTPQNSQCDNGIYCDGQETCDAEFGCRAGQAIDCSGFSWPEIATCSSEPDSNPATWDYAAGFTSQCDEQADACTEFSGYSFSHTCDVGRCGAECSSDKDCPDTDCDLLDRCQGNNYLDYHDAPNSCLSDCTCTYNICDNPDILANDERCVECISDSDCDDGIGCTYDACISYECAYTPNSSQCDNGIYCDGQETCDAEFGCRAGQAIDCSGFSWPEIATCSSEPDSNPATWDYAAGFTSQCDEQADACTTRQSGYSYSHTCDKYTCGAMCETDADCTEIRGGECLGNCSCKYPEVLNVTGIECFPDIIAGAYQSCSVFVASNVTGRHIYGAEVKIHNVSDGSVLAHCMHLTDNITGGCSAMFPISTAGNYTVYATASKPGHINDEDEQPQYSFTVWRHRYDIHELRVYNDSMFTQEDYDFFRNETLYVKFMVWDNEQQEYIPNIVTRATLVSQPGGRKDLALLNASYPWYYYTVQIPRTHDFLGSSQVFTFAFNFSDSSGGQKHVNLTIRNNPPVIRPEVPDIVVNQSTVYVFTLTPYEWDVEDYGENLTWEVQDINTKLFYASASPNDNLAITPVDIGTDRVLLVLKDLDNDIDYQWINITTLVKPSELVDEPENIYPRRSIRVSKLRINGDVFDDVCPGAEVYFSEVFENIGVEDIRKATIRITCEGLGISRKIGPFDGPMVEEIMAKGIILDIPETAAYGIYTCRWTLTTDEGLRRVRHRDMRVVDCIPVLHAG